VTVLAPPRKVMLTLMWTTLVLCCVGSTMHKKMPHSHLNTARHCSSSIDLNGADQFLN